MGFSVGMEVELELIDKNGFISNLADPILQDKRNKQDFTKEVNHSQIEINSAPAGSIAGLHQDLRKRMLLLEEVCSSYDVMPVSVGSEPGAGKGLTRSGHKRYDVYPSVIGKEADQQLNTISGVHLHLCQYPQDKIEQFCLLTALDPLSFSVTSTSPISYERMNGINNHRVSIVRDIVFKSKPGSGQLQPYPETICELEERIRQCYEEWKKGSGLPEKEFEEFFSPQNTGYAPIRKRDSIGEQGTWEVRSFDTAPLDIILAAAALYTGCYRQAFEGKRGVEISKIPEIYSFGNEKIIIPHYETLKRMETEAINSGIKSDLVADYLAHVLNFAEQGLSKQDSQYLLPLKELLQTRTNYSDQTLEHVRGKNRRQHCFTPDESAQGNLFLRHQYLKGMDYLSGR